MFSTLFVSSIAFPQWRSSDIPDSLKRNADAVIRRYATDIKVLRLNRMEITVNKVVTVLNEKGKDFADFSQYYDKNTRIDFVKGTLFNDQGKIVKKSKKSDFSDVSIMPDFTLYADSRMIYTQVYPTSYPFTIEYEYRIVVANTFAFPTWIPQYGYRIAIENATLRVNLVDSSMIRNKCFNISSPLVENNDDFGKVLIWEVNNLKPFEKEPYSPRSSDFLPEVLIAPNQFTYEGTTGSMISWQSYGKWVSELLVGRDDLSPKAKLNIHNLTAGVSDVKEMVRIVYKFLQSHSRYVSIQLGIGGFQPFPASDVEKYGYGDCKALTNYTRSLLSALGIESFYCEIGVGNARISFDDFSTINQTDHVFLCVPIEKDTVWLECTNQNTPFGYVSHVKQNQKALLVNGDSSRLVNLPRALPDVNIQVRTVELKVDSIGNIIGEMLTKDFGAEVENLFPEIWTSKKEQLEIIQRKYRIPGIVFKGFEYSIEEIPAIKATEKIFFTTSKMSSVTGKRIFLPFNPFASIGSVPAKSKKRITGVEVDECFTHYDTLVYSIPKGYDVESMPKSKFIDGMFGSYYFAVTVEGEKVITTRKYQQKRAKYPAKEYNNFIDFLAEISKQDKQSIVLVSKK